MDFCNQNIPLKQVQTTTQDQYMLAGRDLMKPWCYAHLTWGALKVSFDWHNKSAIATGVFSAATLTITEPIAVTCYKITSVKSYEEICAA